MKKSILVMTLNHLMVRLLELLEIVEYPFIAITPKFYSDLSGEDPFLKIWGERSTPSLLLHQILF